MTRTRPRSTPTDAPIDAPTDAAPSRLLVRLLVRLPNWVGDVCMALPALRELEARGAALTVAGRGWAADLLAGHGWPTIRLPAGLRASADALRAARARRGLLLTNSLSSALAFRLAGVSAVGYRNEGRSPLLGRALRKPDGLHEVEVFWRLAGEAAAWIGLDGVGADGAGTDGAGTDGAGSAGSGPSGPAPGGWPPQPPPSLGLRPAAAHRAAAAAALRAVGLTDGARYVVLAPLAAGTIGGASKVWPGFGALERRLRGLGIVAVCCPGPGEEGAARAALPGARLLAGLGLGAYAAVCAGARLTVANDSGPMHVAAAVDAPVLGVFGPGDPRRTRPWGPRAAHLGGGGRWPEVEAVADAVVRVAA